MKVNPKLILHDKDKTNVDWLKEGTITHWIWKHLIKKAIPDELGYGISSCGIQITETVKPEIYRVLQNICKTLEIPQPYLYLENYIDDIGSLYSDDKVFILVNPLYLDLLPEHLIPIVLIRECAHIYCGHYRERSEGLALLQLLKAMSGTDVGVLAGPFEKILMQCHSNSELTADRMAMIYYRGTDELVELCYRSAGYIGEEIPEGYLEAFKAQMQENRGKVSEFKTRKTLMDYGIIDGKFPTYAERIDEALRWEESEDFRKSVCWFWEQEEAEEVKFFYSSKDLKGKTTEQVKQAFEESNFRQILFIEQSGLQQETAAGKVTSVSIDGRDSFEADEWYKADSKVIINYKAR